jgi:hypothetical protein
MNSISCGVFSIGARRRAATDGDGPGVPEPDAPVATDATEARATLNPPAALDEAIPRRTDSVSVVNDGSFWLGVRV